MSSYFSFGSHSTADFDMHIEKIPIVKSAKRKRTTVSVPGRNGDLHYSEDAYSNYTQTYECYFHGNLPTPEQASAIKNWLMPTGDYLRLEDSYDPKHYRMATFIGPVDVTNYVNRYGRCTLSFDCAPQRFLKSGEVPVVATLGMYIHNPTPFPALPLITVYGSSGGALIAGNATVTIKELTDQITLDCETENAYRQVGDSDPENKNVCINAPKFPALPPGDSQIVFTGGITGVTIIPRWWEL